MHGRAGPCQSHNGIFPTFFKICPTHPLTQAVAYDDPLAPVNPCFYCKRCLGFMHPQGVIPQGTTLFPYSHEDASGVRA